jgi:hypothetical protein
MTEPERTGVFGKHVSQECQRLAAGLRLTEFTGNHIPLAAVVDAALKELAALREERDAELIRGDKLADAISDWERNSLPSENPECLAVRVKQLEEALRDMLQQLEMTDPVDKNEHRFLMNVTVFAARKLLEVKP